MVDEIKETPQEVTAPAKKGGLMKWILLGLVFVVLTGAVAVGTVFIIGVEEPVATDSTSDGEKEKSPTEAPEHSDAVVQKDNSMDEMMKNLEILDYKPGPNELTTKDGSMIVQDSIDAATFIAQEKQRLAEWKNKIETRQKELDKIDRLVSAKLLKIEEVESAKVQQLAKLYDGMQAPAVAQLMANLDDNTIVQLLPKMNSKQASAVLALMPPQRAAKLSKQMMTIAEN